MNGTPLCENFVVVIYRSFGFGWWPRYVSHVYRRDGATRTIPARTPRARLYIGAPFARRYTFRSRATDK